MECSSARVPGITVITDAATTGVDFTVGAVTTDAAIMAATATTADVAFTATVATRARYDHTAGTPTVDMLTAVAMLMVVDTLTVDAVSADVPGMAGASGETAFTAVDM